MIFSSKVLLLLVLLSLLSTAHLKAQSPSTQFSTGQGDVYAKHSFEVPHLDTLQLPTGDFDNISYEFDSTNNTGSTLTGPRNTLFVAGNTGTAQLIAMTEEQDGSVRETLVLVTITKATPIILTDSLIVIHNGPNLFLPDLIETNYPGEPELSFSIPTEQSIWFLRGVKKDTLIVPPKPAKTIQLSIKIEGNENFSTVYKRIPLATDVPIDLTFYGIGQSGSANDFRKGSSGIVKFNPGGSTELIHRFGFNTHPEGERFIIGGIINLNGRFYSTLTRGGRYGQGAIFSVRWDGSDYQALHYFDSASACGESNITLLHHGGRLWGATQNGDAGGCIYSIDTTGADFKVESQLPAAGYIEARFIEAEGKLWSMISYASDRGDEVVSLDPQTGEYEVVHTFGTSQKGHAALSYIQNEIWGVNTYGGFYDRGIIWKMGIDGEGYKILKHFDDPDIPPSTFGRGYPNSQLVEYEGKVMGTLRPNFNNWYDFGLIFEMNYDGSGYTRKYGFSVDDFDWPINDILVYGEKIILCAQRYGGFRYTSSPGLWGVLDFDLVNPFSPYSQRPFLEEVYLSEVGLSEGLARAPVVVLKEPGPIRPGINIHDLEVYEGDTIGLPRDANSGARVYYSLQADTTGSNLQFFENHPYLVAGHTGKVTLLAEVEATEQYTAGSKTVVFTIKQREEEEEEEEEEEDDGNDDDGEDGEVVTGIADELRQSYITIYPNPAYGDITLGFPQGSSGRYLLQVISIDGRLIKESAVIASSNPQTLGLLQDLEAGVYQLVISNDRQVQQVKLIKQ